MNAAKINPGLSAQIELVAGDQWVDAIVRFRPRLAAAAVQSLPDGQVRRTFTLGPAAAVTVTPGQVHSLSDRADVDMIWPDFPVHTMLDVSVPIIRAPQVWQAGFTGKGVVIAIVDTGVDPDHPDLAGRILATNDVLGGDGRDDNGHGTHVASIAAGSGAASNGTFRGVAPEASLIVAKVLKADGTGKMSDVMAGIEWAVKQKAGVINVSLGGPPVPSDGTDALSEMCDAATDQGVVVCVAAGNAGPNPQTIGAPAASRKAITVGATVSDRADADRVADFSARGPTSDGRPKPDVAFPGVNIMAARAKGTSLGAIFDDHYTELSGTSMATPHCTGTVALLRAAHPELSAEEVKARVLRGAHDMTLDANVEGRGRGDAYTTFLDQPGRPIPLEPVRPAPVPPGPVGCLPAFLRPVAQRLQGTLQEG